jgi:hypothetical protein
LICFQLAFWLAGRPPDKIVYVFLGSSQVLIIISLGSLVVLVFALVVQEHLENDLLFFFRRSGIQRRVIQSGVLVDVRPIAERRRLLRLAVIPLRLLEDFQGQVTGHLAHAAVRRMQRLLSGLERVSAVLRQTHCLGLAADAGLRHELPQRALLPVVQMVRGRPPFVLEGHVGDLVVVGGLEGSLGGLVQIMLH